MSTICQVYSLYAGELWLGRRDEGGMRSVAIDISPWLADLVSGGTFMLAVSRPGEDDSPYNPVIVFDGQKIVWAPDDVDTAIAGTGTAELRYYVGTDKIKSKPFKTIIAAAPFTMLTPPSAIEPFVERIEQAAADATAASVSAAASATTATEHAETAETKASEASTSAAQADASADAAAASATSAAGSATAAGQSATAAANAAEDAAESEQIAAAAANAATAASGTATTKAAEAAQSATSAAGSATAAAQSATASSASAGDAEQAAETATAMATEASASAAQADASADAASASATSAAGSATAAAQSATAASNAQIVAEAARAAAQAARTGAEAAQTGAETAQAGAETAQGAAESAAASVSASAAQIATNTADISAIKADLLHKANIDGAYSDLTAGNAEQLVSTVYEEDSVPYIFRTAGGSMDIGDREEDMLVGGTVAWNQFLPNGQLPSTDFRARNGSWRNDTDYSTYIVSEPIASISIVRGFSTLSNGNHRMLFLIDINPAHSKDIRLWFVDYSTNTSRLVHVESGKWNSVGAIKSTTNKLRELQVGLNCSESNGYAVGDEDKLKNFMLIDLTQMFGSTIADYVYSLETATPGAGVAWFRKLFPADYYPYDAGTLKSVEGVSSHDMVGFNQWDEDWEVGGINAQTGENVTSTTMIRSKNFCKCLPNTQYCKTAPNTSLLNIFWYDADKQFISVSGGGGNNPYTVVTSPNNAHYFKLCTDNGYGTTYGNNFCISLHWDGERDGEYEPYVKRSYPLDSSLTLRGIPKLDSANNLYYDGDTYESDGTVTRRYGIVDLGTLNWIYRPANGGQMESELSLVAVKNGVPAICENYANKIDATGWASIPEGYFQIRQKTLRIATGSSYTDASTFKQAMSGVLLVYELAEPTTEIADPYQTPQIVDDFGTEEYVTTSIVPVGHVTKYKPNLRAKLEMSPDSPDGDGDYIVRQANGENSYVSLASTTTIQDILARLTALEGGTT